MRLLKISFFICLMFYLTGYLLPVGLVTTALSELEISMGSHTDALEIAVKSIQAESEKAKLSIFKSDSFIESEALNREVAEEVSAFFKKGNEIGIYKRNIEKINELIGILEEIKADLPNNVVPDVSVMWKLYQKYSLCSLFGNYSTILGKRAFGVY